ncbi:MAG: (d)CMP kinase, partial [Gemmatimonadaceae bacterium]|nr:(d)CMP kinase [Gemmatimonadaceae bacterium]
MSGRPLVIAIDGPAASGKSSTAQWVATQLGIQHVDSGALYRALTAVSLEREPDTSRWTADDVVGSGTRVSMIPGERTFIPLIDGVRDDELLRGSAVTAGVSVVAQIPEARAWVNAQVRAAAEHHAVVVDGRDIGTVVFPEATLKIFLVADPWERARRRLQQRLGRAPAEVEIAEETERLVRRDAADSTQTVQARDAVLLDTTYLTQADQVARIVALARASLERSADAGD